MGEVKVTIVTFLLGREDSRKLNIRHQMDGRSCGID